MSDLYTLQRKQNQTFILVCVNFVLFMILFSALGYVTWQSAALVSQLKADLDRAEQTIARLQERIQNMDTEAVVDRLVASAAEHLRESIGSVVQESELTVPIHQASEKLAATQDMIAGTAEAIQGIHETVKGVDNEEIAKLVAYYMLSGIGEGFQQAAESRKPESLTAQ